MLWTVDPAAEAPLHEQIAANVRRAMSEGDLADGERLPPASEVAAALGVNANTVLQAFRLRDEGLVEFRRGRGVRVSAGVTGRAAVVEAARELLVVGRGHGYTRAELADLLADL
jgi:GntR family transcriptional regulator